MTWEIFLSTYLGHILGFIGLFGVCYTVYSGYTNKSKIVFQHRSQSVIAKSTNDIGKNIDITYKKNTIRQLTISHIAIWNSGKQAVRGTDISRDAPYRISVGDKNQILDYQIVSVTKPASGITLIPAENNLTVNFNYLNHKEGVLVKILHDGNEGSLQFSGSAADCKELADHGSIPFTKMKNNKNYMENFIFNKKFPALLFLICFTLGISLITYSFYYDVIKEYSDNVINPKMQYFNKYIANYILLFQGLGFMLFPFYTLHKQSKNAPESISIKNTD